MRPHTIARLRDSYRIFRGRPIVSMSIGLALVLSLASVCCGLGLIAAPWFACELSAFHMSTVTGRRTGRSLAWIGAIVLQLLAVVVVSAGTWLTASALGANPAEGLPSAESGVTTLLLGSAGAVTSVCFFVPFLFAPHILVYRGGAIRAALSESARLVFSGGFGAHMVFSLVAHFLQLAPFVLGGLLAAAVGGPDALPFGLLGGTILLSVSVPIGQGMITLAYLERADELSTTKDSKSEFHSPRLLSGALAFLSGGPPLALLLVWSALIFRPSSLAEGAAPEGELVLERVVDAPVEIEIPETTLRMSVRPTGASVFASDGGGVGELPLREPIVIERVRVIRVRGNYAVELRGQERSFVTLIDRAGVRLDDDLAAHLSDHIGSRGLVIVVLTLLFVPFAVGRVLAQLGALQRHSALRPELRPRESELLERRQSTIRMGWITVLLCGPAVLCSLYLGARAIGLL